MSDQKIRVGLIGAGFWARYGHIPALRETPGFEITAISARSKESAESAAQEFGIPHAFGDPHDLIARSDVDFVVIATPPPDHAEFIRAAIAAGKDVYSEWPLTPSTAESTELLQLAEAKGVHHVVGLQRWLGPSAQYAIDLVRDGYVGRLRSARLAVGTDAFPPARPQRYEWTFSKTTFTNALSVYTGHHLDTLFRIVGPPDKLTAVVENQFPTIKVIETGEDAPNDNPDAVVVAGTLQAGGVFSAHLQAGQKHQTGLQIEITGTEGVLRVWNDKPFENAEDNIVEGVTGDGRAIERLPVPEKYRSVIPTALDASVEDMIYLYSSYARDKADGTSITSSFRDAVKQHELIDRISAASDEFFAS